MRRNVILGTCLLLLLGCKDKVEPPELYQIVSHQASSGEWVIVRIDNEKHNRVKITAVCDYYHWSGHERVDGPNSCDLIVGQTLIPNPLRNRPGEFLDVWQQSDFLTITKGDVQQGFSIKSAQVTKD